MKTTGYALREAIKEWELRRSASEKMFKNSLFVFSGESKLLPQEAMAALSQAEFAISSLQAQQTAYNLHVTTVVKEGETLTTFTLAEAIKRVGAAGRIERLWREAVEGRKSRYGSDEPDMVRNKDQETALRTLNPIVATELTVKATRYASALRAAIAVANATVFDLPNLDPKLLP